MSKKIITVLIICMLVLSSCQVEELITEEQYNAVLEENQNLLDQLSEKDQQISELQNEVETLKSGDTEANTDTKDADNTESGDDGTTADEENQVSEPEIIYVGSAYELVQSLRSNAIFFLNPGNYDLSKVPDDLNEHFSYGIISGLDQVSFLEIQQVNYLLSLRMRHQ